MRQSMAFSAISSMRPLNPSYEVMQGLYPAGGPENPPGAARGGARAGRAGRRPGCGRRTRRPGRRRRGRRRAPAAAAARRRPPTPRSGRSRRRSCRRGRSSRPSRCTVAPVRGEQVGVGLPAQHGVVVAVRLRDDVGAGRGRAASSPAVSASSSASVRRGGRDGRASASSRREQLERRRGAAPRCTTARCRRSVRRRGRAAASVGDRAAEDPAAGVELAGRDPGEPAAHLPRRAAAARSRRPRAPRTVAAGDLGVEASR